MQTFLEILAAFGITPAQYPFLILGALIIIGFVYIRIAIGKPMNSMKDNILIMITHMSSTARAKLNPALIKAMSPLQIQPEGQRILQEVGFPATFEKNKDKFFDIIRSKKPETKLEVENYAIYSFLENMVTDGILNRIKIYLYEHPAIRDSFPSLAGIYIRDRYLEEHKDIKN